MYSWIEAFLVKNIIMHTMFYSVQWLQKQLMQLHFTAMRPDLSWTSTIIKKLKDTFLKIDQEKSI